MTRAFAHENTLRVPAFMFSVDWAAGAQCGLTALLHTLFSQALVEVEDSSFLDQSVKAELKLRKEAEKPQSPCME